MTPRSVFLTAAPGRWTILPIALGAIGVVVIMAALAWWALVFGIVVDAGVLSLREAGLCLVDSSGLCQAIAVLCTQDHPFGVRVYSPELLWVGFALAGPGLTIGALAAVRARTAA